MPVYPPYFWRVNPVSLGFTASLGPYAFSLSPVSSIRISTYFAIRIFTHRAFVIDFFELIPYITLG